MIAQFLLTTLLFGTLLYSWIEYRRAPLIGLLSMLAALTGLYFVWVPAHASWLAAFVISVWLQSLRWPMRAPAPGR